MDRYINIFSTSGDVQTAVDNGELLKPYVAYVEGEDKIDWNTKSINYQNMYLTFEIISGGTISWNGEMIYNLTISYSKDNGATWTNITSSEAGVNINVEAGDKVMFKGDNTKYYSGYYNFFGGTAKFNVYGNIMSLINSSNFSGLTTVASNAFNSLFKNCSGIISAENLILPATSLGNYCYEQMFNSCGSLKTAPVLPATTLTDGCYQWMFQSCTSLNYIKCLATDISADRCTNEWLQTVSSTGTFVKKAGVNWASGKNGIPNNWTVIEE